MHAVWDVIILGGGLAGLSLAVELAQPQFAHLKVLVLEQRQHYTRDRTWSYWATHPHRYSHLERKRWTQWKTSLGGRVQLQTSQRAYCTLDADAFYAHAVDAIENSTNVQLRMGAQVHDTQAQGAAHARPVQVQLSGGDMLRSQWVMDARPPVAPVGGFVAQHFEGWEIEADCDCFDGDTLDLMDFQPSDQGLHFFYVLPYTSRRALVETTWVSQLTAGRAAMDYAVQLEQYLARRWPGMRYQVLYRERGILNLELQPRKTAGRIVPLGRNAGTLRPSTGFAFLNTLADARRMAQWLGQTPLAEARTAVDSFKHSRLDTWMDQIFMEGMQADWRRAPHFFMAMFEEVDALTLTDFLSGSSSIAQRARVAMSLPKSHFIHAAWRQWLKRA
jgi:lycopene beta-cyclase